MSKEIRKKIRGSPYRDYQDGVPVSKIMKIYNLSEDEMFRILSRQIKGDSSCIRRLLTDSGQRSHLHKSKMGAVVWEDCRKRGVGPPIQCSDSQLRSMYASITGEPVEPHPFMNPTPIIRNKKTKKEVEVVIGNSTQVLGTNQNKWKLFVQNQDKAISKVEVFLHPTFKLNHFVLTQEPFELERIGWGTFNIDLKVHFVDGQKKDYAHELEFSQQPVVNKYSVEVEM